MGTHHWILTAEHSDSILAKSAGGKATNLARMDRLRLPVPAWFCVDTAAFEEFIQQDSLALLLKNPKASADFEDTIKDAFDQADLPQNLILSVRKALEQFGLDDCAVAVRSSGLDEDSAAHSFAGQYASFLFQKGERAVLKSIKQCWASAYSARILSYRHDRGLADQAIQMGVIVQKMLFADAAGVAFSRHPIKLLDHDLALVSAVYGAGEGLVSGQLDADSYTVGLSSGHIEALIVEKKQAYVQSADGGLVLSPVPASQSQMPVLSDLQISAIVEMCKRLEAALGLPQDIEWVYERNHLYVVQTRPITNLPSEAWYDPSIHGSEPRLWDNSNIIESYSGVTSPLTFSFASRAYNQVYIQFCSMMGVPTALIEAKSSVFRNMLGLINGRIYYNLINWYQLVLMLPGSAHNKSFMETMMGVKQGIDPKAADLFAFAQNPPHYSIFIRARLLCLTIWRFFTIDHIIQEFFDNFNQVYTRARQRSFRSEPLTLLAQSYHELEEQLLKRWFAPIVNDYLCMIFFGLLKKLTALWVSGVENQDSLQNDLLCGEGGLDSTEPTKMLMRIAAELDQGPVEFRSWFLSQDSQAIMLSFNGLHKTHPIAVKFKDFLDRFGFRCVNELKLEERDLHDDPSFVLHAIASYVRSGNYQIHNMEERERAIRQAAESIIQKNLSTWRLKVYNFVLKQARLAVKNRENLRFARTKIFGLIRHLFRAMGDRLVKLSMLDHEDDIFYLTVEEISAFVEGRTVHRDLRGLTQARKIEFDSYRKAPAPPDRFLSHGAVGLSLHLPQVLNAAEQLAHTGPVSDDPNLLFGTPCCPGIVEGPVRVVHQVQDAVGLEGLL
ncbi:MAG: hypothetical protein NTX25_13390, partial [Proteobacteria bacterium]|nr:hypothetical protein [Pseudomonadota bacterium]